jgi:hypothetical protein
MSQKHWMYYPLLRSRGAANPKVYRLFERRLIQHGLKHEGVFPADPAFYLRFNDWYAESVRRLDCVGLYLNTWDTALEEPIVEFYRPGGKLAHYVALHPDRDVPARDETCYLPAFAGKSVLIVCPFAGILAERATRSTFEGVWSKIGKRWFEPAEVAPLEIPYGFAASAHARYPTVLEMHEEVADEMARRSFDVALIGAGGLGVPLAVHAKDLGRVGLDLGGHLQILFGVLGRKWRGLDEWREAYFNDDWIDMPDRYRPVETDVCPEGGEPLAFW